MSWPPLAGPDRPHDVEALRGSRLPRLPCQAVGVALDALITPARILAGQADDQLRDVGIQLRPGRCTMGIGPGTCDQPPMPAKQRFGLDEEAGPAGSRQRAAEGGEHRPVAGSSLGRGTWRPSTLSW
jgi:hypothetical protein